MISEGPLQSKHKLTADDIIDTVHIFPIMTESTRLVAMSLRKNLYNLTWCCFRRFSTKRPAENVFV